VPRAPLPDTSVTCVRVASSTTSKGITPSSSLLRAHAPNQLPPPDFVVHTYFQRSLQVAASSLLGTDSSRRYLRKSFLRCLALNPDGPTECTCLFLPRRHRPSLDPSQVGLPLLSANTIFHGEVSRLSSGISYVQASEFACLPDRSHRCLFRRAAETFTSRQNVLRYLRTHWICYPSDTGN
jgi:hypothetical protein